MSPEAGAHGAATEEAAAGSPVIPDGAQKAYYEYLVSGGRSRGKYYRRYFLYPKVAWHARGRVLDVGCGLGDFLAACRRSVGVDVNRHCVEHCRRRGLEAHYVEGFRYPFPDGAFDTVLLDNVLEHLADPSALLAEIRRVLKAGGRFIVGVPGVKGFRKDPDHKAFYDEAGLALKLGPAGFSPAGRFYSPFRSRYLSGRMNAYCLFGVFRKG